MHWQKRIWWGKRKKAARKDALNKGNDRWIAENKDEFLEKLIAKLNEYEKKIQNLEDNRKELKKRLDELKIKFNEANEEIEIAFDDLANINPEIKDRKRLIRKNKKIYLSNVIIESFDDRFKEIKSLKFKKYDLYTKLQKIIKEAKKSNSAKDFVGKNGYEIPWPKLLGGGSKKISTDKIGLIERFEAIEDNKSLGAGSKTHASNMIELDEEIRESKNAIEEFILLPVQELISYDNALEEEKAKTPWIKYAIYLVIFLALVAGILYLILYLKAKKDLEEKVKK